MTDSTPIIYLTQIERLVYMYRAVRNALSYFKARLIPGRDYQIHADFMNFHWGAARRGWHISRDE